MYNPRLENITLRDVLMLIYTMGTIPGERRYPTKTAREALRFADSFLKEVDTLNQGCEGDKKA